MSLNRVWVLDPTEQDKIPPTSPKCMTHAGSIALEAWRPSAVKWLVLSASRRVSWEYNAWWDQGNPQICPSTCSTTPPIALCLSVCPLVWGSQFAELWWHCVELSCQLQGACLEGAASHPPEPVITSENKMFYSDKFSEIPRDPALGFFLSVFTSLIWLLASLDAARGQLWDFGMFLENEWELSVPRKTPQPVNPHLLAQALLSGKRHTFLRSY